MSAADFDVTIEHAPSVAAVEAAWRQIEDRAGASFFVSACWIGAWMRAASPHGMLFVASREGRAVGAAVLVRAPRSLRNPWRNEYRLHETGDGRVDGLFVEYNSLLAERELLPAVQGALLSALKREAGTKLAAIAGSRLVVNAATPDFAAAVLEQCPGTVIFRRDKSPFVDLARLRREGTAFLDALSANSRQQLRRARRAFEEAGPLQLERADSVDQAMAFLAALKPLHIARWRALGKPSGFDNPAFEPMLQALISGGVPRGVVDVLRISVGSRRLGYLVNFSYRGVVMNYTSGFDYGDDRRLKPGLVSHLLAIEHANAAGASSYKFLAGGGRYKESLSTDSEELLGLRIPF
jgi:CelD/BcsL family acetyltransferase involved in cellulose biosynthesis